MQKFKRNLVVPLQTKIHTYDPVREVCRFMSDNYLLLSDNFDDMINANKVGLRRKVKYYFNLAIHLAITIKYIILVNRGDNATAAMFGESLHAIINIHYLSGLCLSIQMTMVPCIITNWLIGDQYLAKLFRDYCHIDCSKAFNRINNRKLSLKLWLMSKVFRNCLSISTWLFFPLAIIFCSISVYIDDNVNNSITLLVIGSVIQLFWINNSIGIHNL